MHFASRIYRFSRLSNCLFRYNQRHFSTILFTEKHEWIKVDGNEGTIGISKYAEEKLGDIVYIELPKVGDQIVMSDQCGVVESVKAVSEIYSPASGTVTAVNSDVEEKTSLINKSPMSDGWLFKLRLSNIKELDKLMPKEKYEQFLELSPDA